MAWEAPFCQKKVKIIVPTQHLYKKREVSGAGSRSIPLTRIQETWKHADPNPASNPDLQHWCNDFNKLLGQVLKWLLEDCSGTFSSLLPLKFNLKKSYFEFRIRCPTILEYVLLAVLQIRDPVPFAPWIWNEIF
jgi:hypothetical protein